MNLVFFQTFIMRLYRQYKKDVLPEKYVLHCMPRYPRSHLCRLRCEIAVETWKCMKQRHGQSKEFFCTNVVENGVHFLVNCDTYSDLRYDLFSHVFISIIHLL